MPARLPAPAPLPLRRHTLLLLLSLLLVLLVLPFPAIAAKSKRNIMPSPADPMPASSSSSSSEVDKALRLEWEDIYYRANAAGTAPGREILRHVSGQARAGRLLAIMGPSGSGKTTLLNTLSGQLPYHPNMRLTGNVYVVEEDPVERKSEERGRRRIPSTGVVGRRGGSGESGFVFVKQEDLFYSQLTVREVLLFTARLRLSRKMADAEKRAYVDDMINRMGLIEAADTLVGDEKKRGISGGERKRLSLACELMGNPSKIIFADEPTSGLDSFQSQSVMTRMKRLCEDGPSGQRHTVIVSIHQPRSTVYSMFDDIILLSEGQVIYHGPAEGAIDHFDSLGFVCPSHFNPSEWMLDLVSIDHSSPERRVESQQRVRKLAQAYEDSLLKQQHQHQHQHQHQQQSDISGAVIATTTSSLPSSSSSSKRKSLKTYLLLSSMHARHASTRQHHPSWFAQFRLLIARQWKQTSRDLFTNGLRATTTLLLAAMFGSIFYQLDKGEDGIEERSAVLMHTCINTAMIAMVKTLNLFTRERAVIGRERTKSLYSTSAYVLSKVFGELPIDTFFPVIFGCVLCPMVGLQRDGKRFAWFLGTLALQTLTSSALGLTIGSLCPSTEAALTMGPSIMVVLILLSGQVGTKNSKIPPFLRWVQDISIIRWAFEALCLNEFQGLVFTVPNRSPLRFLRRVVPPFLPFARNLPPSLLQISGTEVLKRLDIDPARTSMHRVLQAQGIILVANYLLTYLGLRFRAPRFQPLLPPPPPLPTATATALPAGKWKRGPSSMPFVPSSSRTQRRSSSSSSSSGSSSCKPMPLPSGLPPRPPAPPPSLPISLAMATGGATTTRRGGESVMDVRVVSSTTPSLTSSPFPSSWWKRRRSSSLSSPPLGFRGGEERGGGGRGGGAVLRERMSSLPPLLSVSPKWLGRGGQGGGGGGGTPR